MPLAALIGAALAGLFGGAHCIAMCGGFVTALSSRGNPAEVALRPARMLARRALPYNLGRISTYTALGAIVGGAGGATMAAGDWLALQRALYVLANVLLFALAMAMMSNGKGFAGLQRLGTALFARFLPAVRPLMMRDDLPARYLLGAIWGFVPCGLVYGVLPIALFAGGALQGAAVMLAFGIGTMPNLLAAGWVVGRFRSRFDSVTVRRAAALLLLAFALAGMWRALFGSLSSMQGAFCF
jgi:sulfite exporter TauE/SafE